MPESPRSDVSVILPFGDDEEAVGVAVRRTAEYLRNLGVAFELLAIDEDSGDNSHAVLALLRADVPELRVTHASGRGRGVDVGAARAQGTILLVTTPDVASASLDGAGEALRRLLAQDGDSDGLFVITKGQDDGNVEPRAIGHQLGDLAATVPRRSRHLRDGRVIARHEVAAR